MHGYSLPPLPYIGDVTNLTPFSMWLWYLENNLITITKNFLYESYRLMWLYYRPVLAQLQTVMTKSYRLSNFYCLISTGTPKYCIVYFLNLFWLGGGGTLLSSQDKWKTSSTDTCICPCILTVIQNFNYEFRFLSRQSYLLLTSTTFRLSLRSLLGWTHPLRQT